MRTRVLLAILLGAAPLAAQDEVALTARTRLLDRAWGWNGPAVWLGGQLRSERPSMLLDLSASGAPATHGSWSGEAFGTVRWERGIGRGLAAFTDGRGVLERRLHGGLGGEWLNGLGLMVHRGGFSVGAGAAAYVGTPGSSVGGITTARLILGRMRLAGELGHFAGLGGSRDRAGSLPVGDSLMTPVPPAGGKPKAFSHVLVDGQFSLGVLELSGRMIRRSPLAEVSAGAAGGRGGWQLGAAVEPWAGIRVHFSAGRAPAGPSVYLPFTRQLSLGLSLVDRGRRAARRDTAVSPAARVASFELEALPEGQLIRVRHPSAVQVELVGDFSAWQPVPMIRRSEGWEARLRLMSGVYLINLRVDGQSLEVPAGLSTTEDSFGGRAGVMIVP